jgi:methionyl-tRNA synthetase
VECRYISGSDDHQSYTTFKGEQLGWTPAAVADHFGDAMQKTLTVAEIVPDVYARPRSSPYHIPFVQEFFRKLYSTGKLIVRKSPSLFCDKCVRYVFEAFVSGKCPHCQSPSGGNACEDCGRPNDCVDLIDPVCKTCGCRPGVESLERVYFPLAPYEKQLRDYYKFANMSPHLRALCERMLSSGLPEIALTHHTNWGIPVPLDGFDEQRLYVWFEMAPGFLAAAAELDQTPSAGIRWADHWKNSESKLVQFFGFDNGYFFAVLFPALLLAYDSEMKLPDTFVTNEFYRLDGLKFSTSRNHAIWGRELVGESSADAVRFYLAYTNPEREQSNFVREDFYNAVEREPAGQWQPWLRELGERVKNDYGNRVPVNTGLDNEQQQFANALRGLMGQAAIAYSAETFSPQQATRACCEVVRLARRFGRSEHHWRLVPGREQRRATSVGLELLAAKVLAVISAPVVPTFAGKLWRSLGYDSPLSQMSWENAMDYPPAGIELSGLESISFDTKQQSQVQYSVHS